MLTGGRQYVEVLPNTYGLEREMYMRNELRHYTTMMLAAASVMVACSVDGSPTLSGEEAASNNDGLTVGTGGVTSLIPTSRIVRCDSNAYCQDPSNRPLCTSGGMDTVCVPWQGTGELVCSFAVSHDPGTACECFETQVALCNKVIPVTPDVPGPVGFKRCIKINNNTYSWGGCGNLPAGTAAGGAAAGG